MVRAFCDVVTILAWLQSRECATNISKHMHHRIRIDVYFDRSLMI
jgi:hypothetical protein